MIKNLLQSFFNYITDTFFPSEEIITLKHKK